MTYTGYSKSLSKDEKVAHTVRSVVQDACNNYDVETLAPIFKDVKDKDGKLIKYGTVARKYMRHLLGSTQSETREDRLKQKEIMMIGWQLYEKGINLDESKAWRYLWITEVSPLFSEKIRHLTTVGKVAAMDKWKKPEKKEVDWWRPK